MSRSLRAFALTALVLALAAPASTVALVPDGVTVYVDDDGTAGAASCNGTDPAPTSIQNAVDSVGTNSSILVCPGTYVGEILIEGSGLDGLTIRGVQPWKATIKPTDATDFGDELLEVNDVDRITLRHLRFLIPARTSPCTEVGDVIDVEDSRKVRILSNRIVSRGADTYQCGYRRGIYLYEGTATVAWNMVQDFTDAAIEVCASFGRTRVYRNSVRYFHPDSSDTTPRGTGIEVTCNLGTGPYDVIDNVVRALPSAGDTTPAILRGIDAGCCVRLISGNRVSGAKWGIDINEREFDSVIEDNTITDGVAADEGAGIEVSGDRSLTIRGNDVDGYAYGVDVVNGAGHVIRDNDLRGNAIADCSDQTTGSGTGGTANTWSDNLAFLSSPPEICPSAS